MDPADHLTWLVAELYAAEAAGEKVHVLAHSTNGDHWGTEYAKIIRRFENTVVAQFTGHTHNDGFQIYYDEAGERAIMTDFTVGSVSTFSDVNIVYRILTVDGEYEGSSHRVIDMETYVADVEEASSAGGEDVAPEYYLLYDARKDYGMDTLFPADYDKLVQKFASDGDRGAAWSKFERYWASDVEGGSISNRCDFLCGFTIGDPSDRRKCEEYQEVCGKSNNGANGLSAMSSIVVFIVTLFTSLMLN